MKNKPFYNGQRVVAVVNARDGSFKKGDEKTIIDQKQISCGCWVVDVGLPCATTYCGCSKHGLVETKFFSGGIGWTIHTHFAPIREVRNHKRIAVPEELLVVKEGDVLEPSKIKV